MRASPYKFLNLVMLNVQSGLRGLGKNRFLLVDIMYLILSAWMRTDDLQALCDEKNMIIGRILIQ